MIRLVSVLAQVDVDPSSDGMPGAELIQKLLNWAQMLALWGSLGALLIGAAMYGLAREGGSYGGATRGKTLAMGGGQHALRGRQMMAGAPKRSRRPRVVFAVMVATVLVAGILVAKLAGASHTRDTSARAGGQGTPATVARPAPPGGAAGPTRERAGLGVGFSRDEPGAVAAAVSYATASQRWLYFSDEEIHAAVGEIATPAAAARMADEIVIEVSTAREQLGASPGRVWWLVRPLAWRVERFRTDEARVAVWVVTILSAAEVAAPQAEYVTVTLDLAWVESNWRIDAVRDTPGPTPLTGPHDQPWDAVPFDQALDGFTRMDGEPVR